MASVISAYIETTLTTTPLAATASSSSTDGLAPATLCVELLLFGTSRLKLQAEARRRESDASRHSSLSPRAKPPCKVTDTIEETWLAKSIASHDQDRLAGRLAGLYHSLALSKKSIHSFQMTLLGDKAGRLLSATGLSTEHASVGIGVCCRIQTLFSLCICICIHWIGFGQFQDARTLLHPLFSLIVLSVHRRALFAALPALCFDGLPNGSWVIECSSSSSSSSSNNNNNNNGSQAFSAL